MKAVPTTKEVKKGLSFNDANQLYLLLSIKGYETKMLSNDNFLDLHYLKAKLLKWIKEVNESINDLAKELDHEIVPIGNEGAAIFQHVKSTKDKDKKPVRIFENATKEFLDKKFLLQNVSLESLKLNFMTLDEFRAWAGNVESQFELSSYLLKEQ